MSGHDSFRRSAKSSYTARNQPQPLIRRACVALGATLFPLLLSPFAQAFEPGEPYFMANGHAYDGTYKFAVPCGLPFTIGLEMRICPSSYPFFPDPGSPVQWSGDLPTPDPDEEQGHLLGCNPLYGSSSISVLYLTPGAKHLHAEVQKYMGEEQGYLTWEGDFTLYVVRVTTNYREVIDDAGFPITYTVEGYDGAGGPADVFAVLWDDNGDGTFDTGTGSTFIKTWSPPATYGNRQFNSSVSARMYPDPWQGAFSTTTAAYYPVKIALSVNVGTDHLPGRQEELDLLGWDCTDPISFDICPNPFFPKQPMYWDGLTDYAKTYWDPPWQGDVTIWGVQVGPKAWDWKREETHSFAYHEEIHCIHMQDVRDDENSMWHRLVSQVGPFWRVATEMVAWSSQRYNCSYKCVDHAVIQHIADTYNWTNVMADSPASPLSEDVRAWLRDQVEWYYDFILLPKFPKMVWGEGNHQANVQMLDWHISPPMWRTYDPCD